jgi:hypothetical protein
MTQQQTIQFPEPIVEQSIENTHPLLLHIIAQLQPELLKSETSTLDYLQEIEAFVLKKGNTLPSVCTKDLQTTLLGMRRLLKKSNLNALQLALDLHRNQFVFQ